MIHVTHKGTNNRLIILLHGTGGDATSLFQLASYLDPDATYCGIQGNVEENGMNRYFKRYHDGSFDMKSLAKETYELKQTIDEIIKRKSETDSIILVGYSNGAYIALNILKEFQVQWDSVILFHPTHVRPNVPLKAQPNLNVLLTFGENDSFVSADMFKSLIHEFKDREIDFEVIEHELGHGIIGLELDAAKEFIKKGADV